MREFTWNLLKTIKLVGIRWILHAPWIVDMISSKIRIAGINIAKVCDYSTKITNIWIALNQNEWEIVTGGLFLLKQKSRNVNIITKKETIQFFTKL